MNFLNPLFLFGLAAAALPILIHLFTRLRPREVKFPSLEFLTEVHQSEIRRLKIKQWLLLLLRTLAVAAFALAIARPAMRGSFGARGETSSTAVALVDVSGSMGAIGRDGRTLSTQAKRIVEDLLATLGPADELLLVPYDRSPHPVSEKPLSDVGRLRAANQALVTSASITDHAAALALATQALEKSHALDRELFWVSDFQASGFQKAGASAAFAAPATSAKVYLVPLAARSRANAALTSATLTPGDAGAALSVSATASGVTPGDFALEARSVGAAGTAGAALGRGFISLPATGDASALLPLASQPEAGGEVLLPDDALALDNRRVFAAGRAGTLRVLLREDAGPSPLRLALEAGGEASGLSVQAVDGATLAAQANTADAIVIGDVARLGPAEIQAVLDFWRGGGGLLLAPGALADAGAWNESLLRQLQMGTLSALETAPGGASWRLLREVAGHPVLEGFPARPGEALSTARFTRARAFAATSHARVLLSFDRAHPALLEGAHALLLTTALDAASGDFAVSGAFLPLVHQAVRVLARGTAAASLTPGESWTGPGSTGAWRVVGEDGRDVAVSLTSGHGTPRVTTAPLEQPGLYRVLENGKLRSSFAVNPDPRESDMTPFDEPKLLAGFPAGRASILRPGEDFARRVREARYGRELWPWFLMLALLFLIAESILGRIGLPSRAPGAAPR